MDKEWIRSWNYLEVVVGTRGSKEGCVLRSWSLDWGWYRSWSIKMHGAWTGESTEVGKLKS